MNEFYCYSCAKYKKVELKAMQVKSKKAICKACAERADRNKTLSHQKKALRNGKQVAERYRSDVMHIPEER